MAKYTWEIREIVEDGQTIFDFPYPIFDETYRKVLEQKIIDWYYFREIGLETVAQFKHFLKARMNVIMPFYNDHYTALEVFKTYDPYINKDITTTETRTTDQKGDSATNVNNEMIGNVASSGNTNTESSGSGTSKNDQIYSDTPQGKLAGGDYATNLTENDESVTNESTEDTAASSEVDTNENMLGETLENTNILTTDEYVQHIEGFDGMKYASDVYMGVRETLINIDQMVIDDLNDLFMNIY